jgi:hypothetical protein
MRDLHKGSNQTKQPLKIFCIYNSRSNTQFREQRLARFLVNYSTDDV